MGAQCRRWQLAPSTAHRTFACQVQKSAARGVGCRTMGDDRGHAHLRAGASAAGRDGAGASDAGPLPDETLDALVTVLDEVRLGHAHSRSEVADHTGLSRAIVSARLAELLDRGLVVEGDPGPSTGGGPPRRLAFRGDAGHVLVADLGASSIDVAVTTLDGRILGHHDEPSLIEAGPDACLERVETLFDLLLRTTPGIPGHLWGVG